MNKFLVILVIFITLLSGCAVGPSAYQYTEMQMQRASVMNSRIVNLAVEINSCPRGYVEVDNKTTVDKNVKVDFRLEAGTGRGQYNSYFPHGELKAQDRTTGRSKIKCEREPVIADAQ